MHRRMIAHNKGSPQVRYASPAVESRLGFRITDAPEHGFAGKLKVARGDFGNGRGLIEAPFTEAQGMQWNRHKEAGGRFKEPEIPERLKEPERGLAAKPEFAAVFDAMDDFPGNPAESKSGNRALEMEMPCLALRADKVVGAAGEGFRARDAKWLMDAFGGKPAIEAEDAVGLERSCAMGAVRREKQSCRRVNKTTGGGKRRRKSRHPGW